MRRAMHSKVMGPSRKTHVRRMFLFGYGGLSRGCGKRNVEYAGVRNAQRDQLDIQGESPWAILYMHSKNKC